MLYDITRYVVLDAISRLRSSVSQYVARAWASISIQHWGGTIDRGAVGAEVVGCGGGFHSPLWERSGRGSPQKIFRLRISKW